MMIDRIYAFDVFEDTFLVMGKKYEMIFDFLLSDTFRCIYVYESNNQLSSFSMLTMSYAKENNCSLTFIAVAARRILLYIYFQVNVVRVEKKMTTSKFCC